MSNAEISYEKKGEKIIITVTPDPDGKVSSTGKSRVVASTQGFIAINGTNLKINLNIIKPQK